MESLAAFDWNRWPPSIEISGRIHRNPQHAPTLRDLSEILALRGIEVSYEAVRDWEAKRLPVMGDELRRRRRGPGRQSGVSWYVDETYLKVRGR